MSSVILLKGDIMSKFSENLKNFREKNKLTQKELAHLLNVNRVSYARWENGSREPNMETIKKIATTLDISVNDLLLEPSWNEYIKKYPNRPNYSKIDWIPYQEFEIESYYEILENKDKRDKLKKSILVAYLDEENIFEVYNYLLKKWKLDEDETKDFNSIFQEVQEYNYLR